MLSQEDANGCLVLEDDDMLQPHDFLQLKIESSARMSAAWCGRRDPSRKLTAHEQEKKG